VPAPLRGAALTRRARLLLPALALVIAAPAGTAVAADSTTAPLQRVAGSETQAVLGAGGAWCWFSDPRSVHLPGPAPRTVSSWIDADGRIVVSAYDHSTKRLQTATVRTNFVVDDHNNPSLLRHDDNRVSVFWSGHNGSAIFVRTTDRPGDVSSFGPTRSITSFAPGDTVVTYTNPVRVPGEGGRIYLFFRSGYSHQGFVTSDDDGLTWSAGRSLIRNGSQRPYVKYDGDGAGTIAMAFTDGHPDEMRTSVRFARYRAGELQGADGRLLAPLTTGIEAAQGDLLWDAAATGVSGWVHDVAVSADGHPVVVFATIRSAQDHRYHYARWDGTTWRVQELGTAGGSIATAGREPSYSAGITLDHDDPSVIYLARPTADPAIAEIERWTTPDAGGSWVAEAVTTGSALTNVRPVRPRDLPDGTDMEAVWMQGSYPHFTTFRTSLWGTASVVPGQPLATTTRINVSALSVVPGSNVRVSARLVDPNGLGLADREVTLLSRPAGQTTWSWVAERRTGLDGLAHFYPQPFGSTEYAVSWPGSDELLPSLSPAALVKSVREATSLRARASAASRLSRTAAVSARLIRSRDGVGLGGRPVQLLARPLGATSYRVVGEKVSAADGLVSFRPSVLRATDFTVRFIGTATHVGTTSAPLRVVLR
jgi:hypothetical protein